MAEEDTGDMGKWFWIIPTLIVVVPLSVAIFYGIRAYNNPKYKHEFQTLIYAIQRNLAFILMPLIFILRKLGQALLYLFPLHRISKFAETFGMDENRNDAWRGRNILTTFIITFVTIFALLIFNVFGFNKSHLGFDFNADGNVNGDDSAIPLPQKATFGEWGTVMAFSFLTILVLYTFYIFHKGKSKDKFPSDKSFREQADWTIKRSTTFLKSLIFLALILGVLIGALYYVMRSPEDAMLISSAMMVLTGIVILTITYFAVKDLKVVQSIMKNRFFQLLYHVIFLVPCLIIEVVDMIYKELKHTPQTIYNILIVQILFVAGYFVFPILQKELYTWIPFKRDQMDAQEAEKKTLYVMSLKLEKSIKEEKNRLSDYPELNNAEFYEKVKRDNLMLNSNEDALDNLIISYICSACKKGNYTPTEFKRDKKEQLKAVKDKLKGPNGIMQKVAGYQSQLGDVNRKYKVLEENIKNGTGGLVSQVLMMKPTYLTQMMELGNYKNLRQGGKLVVDDVRYNYALSCWFFLHSNPPNFFKNKYYSIINYANKPNIMYNPVKSKLKVYVKTGPNSNDKKEYILEDIKLQKWNNLVINYVDGVLDIFIDAKLVGSYPQTIPYNHSDYVSIGHGSPGNGLNGGICNVVFFNNRLTKKRIELNYEYLKNKNPPIL
tara:strand:+ start:722 stop:2707 length:1986 start_codon:yes stop_codon:yes gene_type:complete